MSTELTSFACKIILTILKVCTKIILYKFGDGYFEVIISKMDSILYRDTMRDVKEPFANDNSPIIQLFMHDNDTKHESKIV